MRRLVADDLCCEQGGGAIPSLPYNPDENGDMLIGVVDLQDAETMVRIFERHSL